MFVGYPVPQEAVAMANGVNIPLVFHQWFSGKEEVCIEIGGYRQITIRVANSEDIKATFREVVKLERGVKKRKKKDTLRVRVPFSERVWDWLGIDRHMAGQPVQLRFEDNVDYLSIMIIRD